MADPEGIRWGRHPLLAIEYPIKMKKFGLTETKLFDFHRIFKINEIKLAKRALTRLYL